MNALKIERFTLALFALVAGAYSILALLVPQHVGKQLLGHPIPPGAVLAHQMMGGMQLAVALVAFALSRSPKPARTMVRSIALGLLCAAVGAGFATMTNAAPVTELRAYAPFLCFDLVVAIVLGATQLARR